MRMARVLALGLGSLLAAGAASSEDVAPPVPAGDRRSEGRAVGLGVAVGAVSGSIAGESGGTFAVGIVARLGLDSRNRFQLIAEYCPTSADSPIADESFTSGNILLGCRLGRSFEVRPVVGAEFRWWTGSQRVTASDWVPVVGVDAGPELRLGDSLTISPELVLRLPLTTEGTVNSKLLQCVVAWRGRILP